MHNRTIMLAAGAIAALAFAASAFAFTSEPEGLACTLDARLDAPDGWVWQRDGSNDCAWTLYDGGGNEAPDSVYESAGEEPPPSSGPDQLGIVAFVIGVLATGVSVWAFSKSRAELHGESDD